MGTYTKLYQPQVQYTQPLVIISLNVKWEWNMEQNGMKWNGMEW